MTGQDPIIALVIPARYASTRLPGKPLADILGKPMVQWVYEKAKKVQLAHKIVVATDDSRIADVVTGFDGEYVITSPDHPSGTDRLTEVMQHIKADIYINLQGDEPLVRPSDIDLLIQGMIADTSVQVGTLCHHIDSNEASNPNTVKIVLADNQDALYFSRSPIPYPRDNQSSVNYLKHVGVYGYRRNVLTEYSHLKPSELETTEQLEQLRLLSAGYKLRAFKVEPTGPGVDTPECLEKVRAIIAGQPWVSSSPLTQVKLVITDVDGVLTDGGIYYNETGECLKRFHVRDGLGIKILEESGIKVAVVSGRDSATLRKRIQDLGISLFQLGIKDKAVACATIMEKAKVEKHQTVFIGDDSIDLPAFSACGLSYAVADAPSYIKEAATGTLTLPGGAGAFRELADAILIEKKLHDVIHTPDGFLNIHNNITQ